MVRATIRMSNGDVHTVDLKGKDEFFIYLQQGGEFIGCDNLFLKVSAIVSIQFEEDSEYAKIAEERIRNV